MDSYVVEGHTVKLISGGVLQRRYTVSAPVLDVQTSRFVGPNGRLCKYLVLLSSNAKLNLFDEEANTFTIDLGLACSRLIPVQLGVLIQGDTETTEASVTGGGKHLIPCRTSHSFNRCFSQTQFCGLNMFLSLQLCANLRCRTKHLVAKATFSI